MNGRAPLLPASDAQLPSVWPAVRASNLFDTPEELERFRARSPWKVLVSAKGEAAVLDGWRAHADICAIRGLWCDSRRVPELLEDIGRVALGQGFGRVLSPLVLQELAAPYRRAGMETIERIVTMRLVEPLSADAPAPGLVRAGSIDDVRGVLQVDRASFDDFWRYDPAILGGYLGTERLAVAEADGALIGYTLSTVKGAVGTLGRLAVTPEHRRRGVGSALLAEAMGWMSRQGARSVTLCTQEHNETSRRLYARAGFRELGGRLVFLLSAPLSG